MAGYWPRSFFCVFMDRDEFNLELICTSEFFKKLKLHEPLRRVQFQLFEKLTSAN